MLLTCPICHARYSLDAILQDESARELLGLSGQAGRIWPALVKYLTLFRSESRALAWDRALKLCREVLEIQADPAAMEAALVETVEALRGKNGKPMKNHNYLKRVLENQPSAGAGGAMVRFKEEVVYGSAPVPASKTATAIDILQQRKTP